MRVRVVEVLEARFTSECTRHQIKVELDLAGSPFEQMIDESQIQLAFILLLTDGIDVMRKKGGNLRVRSAKESGGGIFVILEDSGGKIPAEHLERLFKPFLSTRGRGGGVGLATAKRLILLNGGQIHAHCQEEGLTFEIRVPA